MKRQILISSLILLFIAGFAVADTIHVPGAFPYIGIQDAINIAQNGDTIIIAPGTYVGTGFNVNRNITIAGFRPDDPNVVAVTIIDCAGEHAVGFNLFGSGGGTCVLNGLTIANSYRSWVPALPGEHPGDAGNNGTSSLGGGGINIYGNHTVTNCIIRNCQLFGGLGGNGADGDPNGYPGDPCDPPLPTPINYGGGGGRGGHAYGAGIYIASGSPQILNTVVEDCVTIGGSGGAGGVGLNADTGDPPDPNLPGGPGGDGGNGGNAMGGGVYCGVGTSPTFENCTITNCQVISGNAGDGSNGGIGTDDPLSPGGRGGDGGVPGPARGGGVYCETGASATFINCEFTGNQAYGGYAGDGGDAGGADRNWQRGGVGGLVETSFSIPGSPQGHVPPENYSANGGGVCLEHWATADFNDCTFGENRTRGSISGQGGLPTRGIQNQPRKNFRITSYGAGVYCADWTTTKLTDCTVQGNWTTQEPNQYDGDLYPYGLHPHPDFELAGDEYTGYGGGMCFDGGAIGVNLTFVQLTNCNIVDNNAPVGGGVCASALTDFHVGECDFVGNWAYLGAGLFSIDNHSTISSSTFTGNRAYDPNEDLYGFGGGLFSFSSDVLISDCIISENTTSGFGAGLYMAGDVAIPPLTAEPVLKNCLLSNNEAGFDGGGIYCDWYTKPNIINCTITGNEARGDPPFGVGYGGGLYCSYESDVNIINSIVWGNAGSIGPELAVETWFGFAPTTLTVSYCDIEGGQEEVWVDNDSTLYWDVDPAEDPNYPTNIDADPLFVTGPLGDYYLSQTDANSASYPGQDTNSPCVDAGSKSAEALGLQNYTTRTDSVPDVCDVDMGYHYPFIIPEVSCDFDTDGDVDLADLAILLSYWLEQDCDLLAWCEGTDLDRDKDVDFVDYAIFAQAYGAPEAPPPPDTTPPSPTPEIFSYTATPNSITLFATTATDDTSGVEYYFEDFYAPLSNSDWIGVPTWTDVNLTPDTTYTYRVRARDTSVNHNETGWSTPLDANTRHWDENPPAPVMWDPNATNGGLPYETGSGLNTWAHMTVAEATDPEGNGVEYYFECVDAPAVFSGDCGDPEGFSSGWMAERQWDVCLGSDHRGYNFRFRVRDSVGNVSNWSTTVVCLPL